MILMRTLHNDYAKYAREDDDVETLERDASEESGWKLVSQASFQIVKGREKTRGDARARRKRGVGVEAGEP